MLIEDCNCAQALLLQKEIEDLKTELAIAIEVIKNSGANYEEASEYLRVSK